MTLLDRAYLLPTRKEVFADLKDFVGSTRGALLKKCVRVGLKKPSVLACGSLGGQSGGLGLKKPREGVKAVVLA